MWSRMFARSRKQTCPLISHYITPFQSLNNLRLLREMRARGKNVALNTSLHKCIHTIESAIRWLSLQSNQNPHPDNTSDSLFTLSDSDYLFVWQDSGFKKVFTNTITYLEASRSYCEIQQAGASKIVVSVPMSEVGKYLILHNNFIRIHRSFIINLNYVDAFIGNMIVMEGGHKLSVSREYRSSILRQFTFIGSKSRKYSL